MTFADELYETVAHLEQPGSHDLHHFCMALATTFEDIYYLVREDENGAPPWSLLLSPTRVQALYVDWLRQMAGVRSIHGEATDTTRQRLVNGETYERGTRQAIIDKAATIGAPTFELEERYLDSAYHVRLFFTDAEHTDEREAIIRGMIPAGVKVTIDSWGGVLYDDLSGTYDDLAGDFTDYDDLRYS